MPDRRPVTDERRAHVPTRSTPSLQGYGAGWRTPDVTDRNHEAESRSAIGRMDAVREDYMSRTAPSQHEGSDETPDHVPESIMTTTTEDSACASAVSTPISTTQESSNVENVATTTKTTEAQGPGGRFWTQGEYNLVVGSRSKSESWEEIADRLPGRTAEDCRRSVAEPRSRGALGDGSHPHWTGDEEKIMCTMRAQGKKWSEISQRLPARSASGCRIRWKQKFEQKKEKEEPWWRVVDEARKKLSRDRARSRERRRRSRGTPRSGIENQSHRNNREAAGGDSQRHASTFETTMHGHGSRSTVENYPQHNLTRALNGRESGRPSVPSAREGYPTSRHAVQSPLVPPPPWPPSHIDYGVEPASYRVRTNDCVPYPYYQTDQAQQSMTSATVPGLRGYHSQAQQNMTPAPIPGPRSYLSQAQQSMTPAIIQDPRSYHSQAQQSMTPVTNPGLRSYLSQAQQSMTPVTIPDPRSYLSQPFTTNQHSYELPRAHHDTVFNQRSSSLRDDVDTDKSSRSDGTGAGQRRRMLSIQALCTQDGDPSTSSKYWRDRTKPNI